MESFDKRTLIAIILALLVLIGYQFILPVQTPQPLQNQDISGQKERKDPVETAPVQSPTPKEMASKKQAAVENAYEKEIKVETGLYTALLTSKGGTIKRFELKNYRDNNGLGISLLNLQATTVPLAIGVSTDDFRLSDMNFSLKGTDLVLKDAQSGSVTFEYNSPQISIKRTYTFSADNYRFGLKDEVSGLNEYWMSMGTGFGIHDINNASSQHTGPVLLKGTDRIELAATKLKEPKSFAGDIRWVSQEDKYFFASIVPSGQDVEVRAWKGKDYTELACRFKSGTNSYMIYAGPKDYEMLEKMNVGLEHIVDFGFFSVLARPLFWVLKFFYKYFGNYGWAIILLTIITRIPFIPLLNKSQKSMKRMQELQPKLNELKEKHKKDPQRQQKEMMEMYKKHKVNPLGGCLPMLLQIPVFFALYKILMIAIELRGAPFMLWITDLSAKDPYYVMPVVMGITMVIQQRMTPTSLDPKQNKIMMLMPVIFTFMFLNFASGLVLYWLVNNILSIVQQLFVNMKAARQVKQA